MVILSNAKDLLPKGIAAKKQQILRHIALPDTKRDIAATLRQFR